MRIASRCLELGDRLGEEAHFLVGDAEVVVRRAVGFGDLRAHPGLELHEHLVDVHVHHARRDLGCEAFGRHFLVHSAERHRHVELGLALRGAASGEHRTLDRLARAGSRQGLLDFAQALDDEPVIRRLIELIGKDRARVFVQAARREEVGFLERFFQSFELRRGARGLRLLVELVDFDVVDGWQPRRAGSSAADWLRS